VLTNPSTSNLAYGLNNVGDVVGSGNRSGALWTNGRTIALGPLRGYGMAVATAVCDAHAHLTRRGCGSA
jgi:hypothetical protein